jgi:hypothetical protein
MSSFEVRLPSIALVVAALLPAAAHGQLRPLDPLDWTVLEEQNASLELGAGVYTGQTAALAGTKGRLLELGSLRATWTLGRVALEVAGTTVRVFDDRQVDGEPADLSEPPSGERRRDAGVARVSTVVRILPNQGSTGVALRFGVALPTTDDNVGLDRDQTDFYSLVVGRIARNAWSLSGELGLGIYGTRDPDNEQVDPLLFGLRATYGLGPAAAELELAGHHDTRSAPEYRGNEDLGEARLGFRFGKDQWLSVAVVRGWTPTSPDLGLRVRLGRRF